MGAHHEQNNGEQLKVVMWNKVERGVGRDSEMSTKQRSERN